jgi:hypothetical protein
MGRSQTQGEEHLKTLDEHGDPLSPFLWAQRKRPSIFAQDRYFTARYKKPENPISISIKKLNTNQPLPAYSKAKHGNS